MAIKLRMAPQFLLLLLILNGNYGPIKIPKHCSEAVGAEHYMPVTGNGYMHHIRLKFGNVQSPKLCKQLKKMGRVYNVKVRKYFWGGGFFS